MQPVASYFTGWTILVFKTVTLSQHFSSWQIYEMWRLLWTSVVMSFIDVLVIPFHILLLILDHVPCSKTPFLPVPKTTCAVWLVMVFQHSCHLHNAIYTYAVFPFRRLEHYLTGIIWFLITNTTSNISSCCQVQALRISSDGAPPVLDILILFLLFLLLSNFFRLCNLMLVASECSFQLLLDHVHILHPMGV
jgi:hypothetical protein